MLYDGLSSDSNEAITFAESITIAGIRVYAVAVGDSISHHELLKISQKPMYTFSPTKANDLYHLIVKETERSDCNGRHCFIVFN